MLLVDAIGAVALVRFEGLNGNPHLLAQETGNPAARGVFLPAGMRHDLGHGRAALARFSIAMTSSLLVPVRADFGSPESARMELFVVFPELPGLIDDGMHEAESRSPSTLMARTAAMQTEE